MYLTHTVLSGLLQVRFLGFVKGWETRSNTRPIPRSVEKRTSLPILHSPLWSPGCEWEAPRSPKPDATASQRFPVCTGWRANPNRTESRRWCRTSGSLPHGLCGRTKRTNKTEPKLNNCRYTVKGPQRAPTKNCGKGFFLFAGCLLFSFVFIEMSYIYYRRYQFLIV